MVKAQAQQSKTEHTHMSRHQMVISSLICAPDTYKDNQFKEYAAPVVS